VARFVLVHGAWLGGWSWAPLTRELELRGHDVEAPDLPCDDVSQTAEDYARVLGDTTGAVVVAHSLGGLTASLVDAAAHVYVAGLLPVADVYAEALDPRFTGTLRDEHDRSYWPDLATAERYLFPDCTRERAEWAFPQLRRQARVEAVSGQASGTYVACLRDAAVRPDWQRASSELGLEVVELDAGHFPMLTHPRELAEILIEVSRRTPT
jgi:pimeloyl-ACP methyl ester carboxylesterase